MKERVKEVIPIALKVICEFIVNGLHSTHKIPFLLLFLIRAVYANEPEEEVVEIMFTLYEFVQNLDKLALAMRRRVNDFHDAKSIQKSGMAARASEHRQLSSLNRPTSRHRVRVLQPEGQRIHGRQTLNNAFVRREASQNG